MPILGRYARTQLICPMLSEGLVSVVRKTQLVLPIPRGFGFPVRIGPILLPLKLIFLDNASRLNRSCSEVALVQQMLCAVAMTILFVTVKSATAQANPNLLFSSNRTTIGNYVNHIFSMNSDGSDQVIVTPFAADQTQPAVSPDGKRIAFSRSTIEPPFANLLADVYVMDADGTNLANLTNLSTFDSDPSWSPGGSRIAFTTQRDGNSEIYVMRSNGSQPQNLTNDASGDRSPSWSPSGDKIAFVSNRDGNNEIYVMTVSIQIGSGNVFPSNITRLTNDPGDDAWPTWSPDGTKIAFPSDREGGRHQIYVMEALGSPASRLTNDPGRDGEPSWSPDGTQIAFTGDRLGNRGIWLMNADGSNQTKISDGPHFDFQPAWYPETSGEAGSASVYLTSEDPIVGTHFPISLEAGDYVVTVESGSWNAWGATDCSGVCVKGTATGWLTEFSFSSPSITNAMMDGEPIVFGGAAVGYKVEPGFVYEDPYAATENQPLVTFSLATAEDVDFFIVDFPVQSNIGAMWLNVSPVAQAVPAGSELSLFFLVGGIFVASILSLRRKRDVF